jgi:formiminotetrahydrofolate cyclodeaminase
MAARYTTGKRWVDREEDARVLGDRLASLSASLSKLAQEDIDAYSALSAAKIAAKTQPSIDLRPFEAAAAMVPLEVLRLICTAVQDLAAFRPRCNPHLVVDLNSAVFLMAGAARAAAVLVRGNGPNAKILDEVSQRIAIIGRSETL